jgi:hypothetical protein
MNFINYVKEDTSTHPEPYEDVLISDGEHYEVVRLHEDGCWYKYDFYSKSYDEFDESFIKKWCYLL